MFISWLGGVDTWNEGAILAADVIAREVNWKENDETACSLRLFGCSMRSKPVSQLCPSNETPHPAVIDKKLVLK